MQDEFAAAAATFPEPFRLMVRGQCTSTNDDLLDLARQGAAAGLVLLALEQSAGRGRRGAAWFAPAGESLAFSVLLRPAAAKALWPRLALAAGLAVAEAVESFGAAPAIKWPNDVWIGRRKLAGILVEAGPDFVVVGIGINISSRRFPESIAALATSLASATGSAPPRADVLASIVRRFAIRHGQIDADFPILLDEVRQRCALTGHRVSLRLPDGSLTGIVRGLAAGGELRVDTNDGPRAIIQADEIRILDES